MLILVPTPIGDASDMSFHAREILAAAPVIIVEEFKESSVWLRAHGISGKRLERLNEHSTPEDLKALLQLCREHDVPLITDCGTPGFCDPGADLVRLCREAGIGVKALPGPSSLMTLLSLSSRRLDEFVFRGFLPAENQAREKAWQDIAKEKRAIVLMDTPYRFEKTLLELEKHFPQRVILVAADLTQPTEQILEGRPAQVRAQVREKKAEFMVLIYPA
jgi:16S rRNA (cytidine1402-2'-O)-methyltransferase